ncbi:MAG: hypothetical protein QOE89_2165 [Pseudonocardiales bacterium]|nr:hypothetical protein [Pseudonocardiales bacterium]
MPARLPKSRSLVFGSPNGKLRDSSNASGDILEVMDRLGLPADAERDELGEFARMTSHVLRKTVATRLDEAGKTPRQIADHLGHEKPSMTQGAYMGREVVDADAARVADR